MYQLRSESQAWKRNSSKINHRIIHHTPLQSYRSAPKFNVAIALLIRLPRPLPCRLSPAPPPVGVYRRTGVRWRHNKVFPAMIISSFKFVFLQFTSCSFYFSVLSWVKMKSTNWPAPNVWVFITQLVEHCSAKAEAMGSYPVEVPKIFLGLTCNFLNCNYHWDDHIFI